RAIHGIINSSISFLILLRIFDFPVQLLIKFRLSCPAGILFDPVLDFPKQTIILCHAQRRTRMISRCSPATDMNPFQLGDLFQDNLRLIPLKPQLAPLRQAGFQSLHFAKII
ncbi:MAG: hypothetical protein ABIK68_23180, partial [bacterium]